MIRSIDLRHVETGMYRRKEERASKDVLRC